MDKGAVRQVETLKPFYTVRETAALLSISRNTLHRWIRDRVIPWTVKTPGGTRVPGRAW